MNKSTLTRKTPLVAKTRLTARTSLKAHSTLKAKKSLRKCTIEKHKAGSTKKRTQKPYKPKYRYESIFTDNLKKCFITGCGEGWYMDENLNSAYYTIHIHHVFGASNKTNSEKYHFLVPLRDDWHNMSSYGVHNNRELDLKLKRLCQTYFLLCYGSRDDFIKIFGQWW